MFSYSCCFQLLFTIYGFKLSYQACHTTTKATSNSKKILITRKKKNGGFLRNYASHNAVLRVARRGFTRARRSFTLLLHV